MVIGDNCGKICFLLVQSQSTYLYRTGTSIVVRNLHAAEGLIKNVACDCFFWFNVSLNFLRCSLFQNILLRRNFRFFVFCSEHSIRSRNLHDGEGLIYQSFILILIVSVLCSPETTRGLLAYETPFLFFVLEQSIHVHEKPYTVARAFICSGG